MIDAIQETLGARLGGGFAVHARARALLTEESRALFEVDTGPLNSDRGDTALHEFVSWRRDNFGASLEECLRWTVESWDTPFFPAAPLEDSIRAQIAAEVEGQLDFGSEIYARDESVIAIAIAQLFLEGGVDPKARRFIEIALARQGHPLTIAHLFQDEIPRAERARALAEATRLLTNAPAPI